jgi:hypothetical protein
MTFGITVVATITVRLPRVSQVRVEYPAPRLEAGVERGAIATVQQSHVVVNDVEPTVSLHDLLVHQRDLRLVGEISLHDMVSDGVRGLIDSGTKPPSRANLLATA